MSYKRQGAFCVIHIPSPILSYMQQPFYRTVHCLRDFTRTFCPYLKTPLSFLPFSLPFLPFIERLDLSSSCSFYTQLWIDHISIPDAFFNRLYLHWSKNLFWSHLPPRSRIPARLMVPRVRRSNGGLRPKKVPENRKINQLKQSPLRVSEQY